MDSTEIVVTAKTIGNVKDNIVERIDKHNKEIVIYKKHLKLADDVGKSECCINVIRELKTRISELEMVLKNCF